MARCPSERRVRAKKICFFHSHGEIYDLAKVFCTARLAFLASIASKFLTMARKPAVGRPKFTLDAMDLACLAVMQQALLAASIPRLRVRYNGREHVNIHSFDDICFRLKFRFRREHVLLLLQELNLLNENSDPILLRVGRTGRTQTRTCRSDTALLILLRKLSFPARNEDLENELNQ